MADYDNKLMQLLQYGHEPMSTSVNRLYAMNNAGTIEAPSPAPETVNSLMARRPPMWASQLPKDHPNYRPGVLESNPDFGTWREQYFDAMERQQPGWRNQMERDMRLLRERMDNNQIPGLDITPIPDPRGQ